MVLTEMSARYDSDNEIIVIDSKEEGEMTTENLMKATSLALELSRQHYCNSLLFDATKMKEAQTLLQGYEDMKDLRQTTGLTSHHKCAVVFDPAKYSEKRAGFIETVVRNRPNPLFKIFKSHREAIEWLKNLS